MSLHDYISKYFPNGQTGEFEGVSVNIVDHFLDKFGVNVKIEQDLFLFKYNMLFVKFGIPLTRECRGAIYSNVDGKWRCVCRAMDKFWNFDEGYVPIFQESDFKTYTNQIELKTKEDGSLIHIWFHNNEWRLSSSGSIITSNVGDSAYTFEQLFYKTIKLDKETFLSKLDKDNTYIFELCSTLNAIVSMYSNDRVYLLNIRNTAYGTYLPINDVANELQVLVPKSIFLYELGIKTREELVIWVENNCADDADCKFKEGYVAYINSVPIAKIKCNKYKFLHSFKGNNDKETRNNIIDAFFNESLDDVYNSLHDSSKIFIESIRLKVLDNMNIIGKCLEDMKDKTFPTQKDYALYVLANVPKMFNAFFFQNKEKILAHHEGMKEEFASYLKFNYKKYENYWKS